MARRAAAGSMCAMLAAMGDQVRCRVRYAEAESEGTAHLETAELVFRGTFRLAIPFQDVSAAVAEDGHLHVTFPGGLASFGLGAKAARWARAITNPKPVIDKLGVKPGMRVCLLGVTDAGFLADLEARAAELAGTLAAGGCFDLIFLAAGCREDLDALADLERALVVNGGIWVLRPKGSPDVSEMDVLEAGRAAGLVDSKVVAFSPTHSAAKFVIPLARRT